MSKIQFTILGARIEAVNSLDQNWSGEINWMVPPSMLILKCIRNVQREKANGTIIVHLWQSALHVYWPELLEDDGSYKTFVAESVNLRNVICKGSGNNGIFGKEHLSFRKSALKIRF